jgi:hypothetical protein
MKFQLQTGLGLGLVVGSRRQNRNLAEIVTKQTMKLKSDKLN